MAELFKDVYSTASIGLLAMHLHKNYAALDVPGFVAKACENIADNEMKQRANQIIIACKEYLPTDFEHSAQILLASLSNANEEEGWNTRQTDYKTGIEGWLVAPIADYVGLYGQDNFDVSMNLLKELTKRFSSEFGIRYFLKQQTQRTLDILATWLDDPDQHVRRLISEGTRPRLPWGMQLKQFVKEPQPVIDLISHLKDDPEEYVRRSVANNLNDIAKDHPDIVCNIANDWLKHASPNRRRLVKHACRTLLKQGHAGTLKVFGFGAPDYSKAVLSLVSDQLTLGQSLAFELRVDNECDADQEWMIDFIIHHKKSKGHTTPKVFKWKQINVAANQTLVITKKHPFKPITTRAFYAGLHAIEVTINGVAIAKQAFHLSV